MKKCAAIFFLLLLVSLQTPVGQLLKLPVLIAHFKKHQKQDAVSFISFLQDHYSRNHNDADFLEDEQLPFKSINYYSIGSAVIPGITWTTVSITPFTDKKIILPEPYKLQQHAGSIFHPPKI